MVNKRISSHLPIAEIHMAASDKLTTVTLKVYSADVPNCPVTTVGKPNSA